MLSVPPSLFNNVLEIVQSDRNLTIEEKTLITDELNNDPENRGYAGKTAAQIIELLTYSYSIPNVSAMVPITRTDEISADTMRNILHQAPSTTPGAYLMDVILAANADSNNPLHGLALKIKDVLDNFKAISFTNPMVIGMFQFFVAQGIMTQEVADGILLIPDPSYQSQITYPPRLQALGFAQGSIITVRDMESLF